MSVGLGIIIAAGSLGTALLAALIQIITILAKVNESSSKTADRLARIETTLHETHAARMAEAERRISDLEKGNKSIERWIHEKGE